MDENITTTATKVPGRGHQGIQILVLLAMASLIFMPNSKEYTDGQTSMRMPDHDVDAMPVQANNNATSSPTIGPISDPSISRQPTTSTNATTDLADTCRLSPWTERCAECYNTGTWAVLSSPMEWHQTYSQKSMEWNSTRINTPAECQRVGTSLQWQSTTHKPPVWDANRFLQALGPNKRISFVGDSVARQHHATFLEALGDKILNCTGFDYAWGPRNPLSCRTTNNVTIDMVSDNYGSWDAAIGPWDGGIRGKSYNGTMATQGFFSEFHLIVMNFGVWFYEQQGIGVRTNHTPETYTRHMHAMADDVALHRQPHQLVVFRETTGPRRQPNNDKVKAANRELRPYMALRQIPVIYDQSTIAGRTGPLATTVAKLYMDPIHFCEPALQMTWTTILSHILQDWSASKQS